MRYSTMFVVALVGFGTAAGAQETTQPPTRLPAAKVTADEGKAVTVQNDRREAVRFVVETGRSERSLGSVGPNSTEKLQLPTWAIEGKRSIAVLAMSEASRQVIARYEVPVIAGQMLGLLVPPAEGLPAGDSLTISLPAGSGRAATVTIDNARREPVTVFAEQGLRFVRLGDVAANQRGTLTLPEAMFSGTGSVRIFARPAGAAERSTQALKLGEGDHVAIIVM